MTRWCVKPCPCKCGKWKYGPSHKNTYATADTLPEAHTQATQAARAIHGKTCQSCPRTPDDYDCPYTDGYNPGSNSGD